MSDLILPDGSAARGGGAIVGLDGKPVSDKLDVGEDFLSKRGQKLLVEYCCRYQIRSIEQDNVMIHTIGLELMVDANGVPPWLAIYAGEEYEYAGPMRLLVFAVRMNLARDAAGKDHQQADIILNGAREFTADQDAGFREGIEKAKVIYAARKVVTTPDPAS